MGGSVQETIKSHINNGSSVMPFPGGAGGDGGRGEEELLEWKASTASEQHRHTQRGQLLYQAGWQKGHKPWGRATCSTACRLGEPLWASVSPSVEHSHSAGLLRETIWGGVQC